MNLSMSDRRLTEGARYEKDTLILPASGGGMYLPEVHSEELRYLNLHMQLLSDHAQAFELRVYGDEEQPRVTIRFGLNPHYDAAFSLDLNWLDGHSLFPGHSAGMQKIVCHGSRITRQEIRCTTLVTMPGTEPVHVRILGLSLDASQAAPSLSCPSKQIDRFGQYIPKNWPGKVTDGEILKKTLFSEYESSAVYPFTGWSVYGGDTSMPLEAPTGFFHRIKKDGRWFLTDPLGYAFFSLGADCVAARCDARIDGLEDLLEALPSRDHDTACLYEPMRDFGERRDRPGLMFSYERWNLMRTFGRNWKPAWEKMIIGQLMRMGINTLGNWSDPDLFGRMPYVTSLPSFPGTSHFIFRDFPDVMSPEYEENARQCAKALEQRRDDPWMIGYFLRNEPAWAFVDHLIIADEVLRDPRNTYSKDALVRFLRDRYRNAESLSAAWQMSFSSFEDLLVPIEKASEKSPQAKEDLRAFSALLIDRYMRVPALACREVDPNHMILGMRWAWISDPLLVTGWDTFDVFSINCYAVDPTPALDRVRELKVDLPIMIGEFHFGALDAGLPATGLEAVKDQENRAIAYRYYTQRTAAHPQGVGCHWFQCYDQFALGRFDGENYNIGLFDITLRPYPALARAVQKTASEIYSVHAGLLPPVQDRPVSLPMIAY